MRLDLVLKLSGLIKRRTVAKELAERGRILINDKVAKPASEVRNGDLLELHLGNRVLVVEITFVERFKREFPEYKEVLTKKVYNKESDRITEISNIEVKEGEMIRVLDGPLAGLETQIKKVNLHKRTVTVEMSFCKRLVEVKVGINIITNIINK